MSAIAALRAAVGAGYRHSWRLVLLNCAAGAVIAFAAGAAAYTLPAALLGLAAGPLLAALAHCAVVVARTDELSWVDARDGLRLHWKLGFALGALAAVGIALGVLAVAFYAARGLWPVAALAAYLAGVFCVWQFIAWPLAVAGEPRPLARAGRELLRRPGSALVLGAVLLVVNVAGAVVVIPLLTVTLAYSFLATAHFVLEG
jgi:uncharacterized membrane protein YfcA